MGGLITLTALIPALRKAGAEREVILAAARRFGQVSWGAMGVALGTGLLQVQAMGLPWTHPPLHLKLGLVGGVVVLAVAHQVSAKHTPPRVRGLLSGAIVVCSLGVFWAAVHMVG